MGANARSSKGFVKRDLGIDTTLSEEKFGGSCVDLWTGRRITQEISQRSEPPQEEEKLNTSPNTELIARECGLIPSPTLAHVQLQRNSQQSALIGPRFSQSVDRTLGVGVGGRWRVGCGRYSFGLALDQTKRWRELKVSAR